jgi:hypothetical protein
VNAARAIAACAFTVCAACPSTPAASGDARRAADAGATVAHAEPPIDTARVLAIVSEHAPSVVVSLQAIAGGVALTLQGQGPPSIALDLLASLPPRLPGTRVSRLELGADAWTAVLTTTGVADADPTALATVVTAARPVFSGTTPLFAHGTLDVTPSLLQFRGVLAADKTFGDAAASVADGYALVKVERGPPFALDVAPSR